MKTKKGRYRRGIFVVTYAETKTKNGKKIEYLILKRKHHWTGWEFPKGGINPLETRRHAVRREVMEESGLKMLRMRKFDVHEKYTYNKEFPDRKGIIGQTFCLYAAEVEKSKVKIDKKEHSEYKWLTFKEAKKKLTWQNQKRCLNFVDIWLEAGNKN